MRLFDIEVGKVIYLGNKIDRKNEINIMELSRCI